MGERRMLVGVVGGHPMAAAGLANALEGAVVIVAEQHAELLVADLTCPGCSPSHRDLEEAARRVPVVVVASTLMVGAASRALDAGARGAVAGWEPVDDLLIVISAAASGRQQVSPAIEASLARVREVKDLLSPRELDVLGLYAADLPVKSVARRLDITTGSAKEYLKRLRSKLVTHGEPVATKFELRVLAEEVGLLTPHQRCAVGSTP